MEPIENTEETQVENKPTKTRKFPSKFTIHQNFQSQIQKEASFQNSSSFSHVNEIGKEIGLEIWKIIDKDSIQKVPKAHHGSFETNKSYLLLMGKFSDDQMTVKEYSIHFWIGELLMNDDDMINFCNQRVEELDFILKKYQSVSGDPIHYREFQGKEGDIFMSYFKNQGGPRYIAPLKLTKAAIPAAGDHKAAYKLYHLKGRRNVRIKQVELSAKSLNSGDVFVLDCPDTIFQWNGNESSRIEKGKGLDLTVRLRDEKSARAKIVVFDEADSDEHPDFFKRLGGSKSDVQKAEAGGDDFDYEKKSVTDIKLYQVDEKASPDQEVSLHIIEPIGDAFSVDQLNSKFCYIMDCETELFVWSGKATSAEAKALATSNAMDLLHDEKRPVWTPITKMSQGAEVCLFKDKFKKGTWGEFKESYDKKVTGKIAATVKQEKINIDQLHNPEKYKLAQEEMKSTIPTASQINESFSGELKIWVVRDKKNFEIPELEHGIFYSSSCYLVLFTLVSTLDNSRRSILYYWQGRFSNQEDKGLSALLAKDISANVAGGCIQVRVVQNKEPIHFLQHFVNKMVVLRVARPNEDSPAIDFKGLFHVRGTNEFNVHGVQTEQKISSLDSNDSFIVSTDSTTYIWAGKYSDEKEVATILTKDVLKRSEYVLIEEGSETEAFWNAVQENGASAEKKYFTKQRTIEQEVKTRLFQCSNNSGVFKVFEIFDFSQDDLDPDDVMILDTGREVFVWIGQESSDIEKSMSMDTALEYVQSAAQSRKDDPIYRIEASQEPIEFTGYFHSWDVQKVNQDPYKTKLEKLLKGQPGLPMVMPPTGLAKLKPSSATPAKPTPTEPVSSLPKLKPVAKPSPVVTPTVTKDTPVLKPSSTSTQTPSPTPTQPASKASSVTSALSSVKIYPLSVLKQKPLPSDVDASNLHNHLSDAEFLATFKVSKDEFSKFPAWKQLNLKKGSGLF